MLVVPVDSMKSARPHKSIVSAVTFSTDVWGAQRLSGSLKTGSQIIRHHICHTVRMRLTGFRPNVQTETLPVQRLALKSFIFTTPDRYARLCKQERFPAPHLISCSFFFPSVLPMPYSWLLNQFVFRLINFPLYHHHHHPVSAIDLPVLEIPPREQ